MLELMVQSSAIHQKIKTGIFMRVGTLKEPVREVTLGDVQRIARTYIRASKKLLVEHLTNTDILEFDDVKFSMNRRLLEKGSTVMRTGPQPTKKLTGVLMGMDEFLKPEPLTFKG